MKLVGALIQYSCGICLILIACADSSDYYFDFNEPAEQESSIIGRLTEQYIQLPEQAISISKDSSVYAQYAMPTEHYGHGILGDRVEAQQLVVVADEQFYELTLDSNYVYEDIRPRLYDVDGDGYLEIITIRTEISKGAGIVIYKIVHDALTEYAIIEEIGTPYRWLNIAAIDDLEDDGVVEIFWIETPHIGGTLKVAEIKNGILEALSSQSTYSNHAIGLPNLCLSAITEESGQKKLYVPNQSGSAINGFTFTDDNLLPYDTINKIVDFSMPLQDQNNFSYLIMDPVNCIY